MGQTQNKVNQAMEHNSRVVVVSAAHAFNTRTFLIPGLQRQKLVALRNFEASMVSKKSYQDRLQSHRETLSQKKNATQEKQRRSQEYYGLCPKWPWDHSSLWWEELGSQDLKNLSRKALVPDPYHLSQTYSWFQWRSSILFSITQDLRQNPKA